MVRGKFKDELTKQERIDLEDRREQLMFKFEHGDGLTKKEFTELRHINLQLLAKIQRENMPSAERGVGKLRFPLKKKLWEI